MSKLKALPARITAPPNRIGPADSTERSLDRYRAQATPWRAWYGLKRWADLRRRIFLRDLFTCRRCGLLEGDTSKLVANHRRPHRGDAVLFWDEANVETVCTPCHDGPIQAEERRAQVGCDRD